MQINKEHEKGLFDIIGDVHGCFDELKNLLDKLGYRIKKGNKYIITHPQGRRIIFVGDLVDRGPNSPEVLRLVMDSVSSSIAFCVNGNHDDKLKRKLQGRNVVIAHGLQETLEQLENEPAEFKASVLKFLEKLNSYYILDDEKLAVAHAGIKEKDLGRSSERISKFCMYGATTGEIDEFGLPFRYSWDQEYQGNTLIVYGHTPVSEARWLNNTINIDTGCVFGGKLTALRYPEKELVSVDAAKIYCKPIKPFRDN
ncbi:MAG TPA: metallophosphoesterase [Rickettsia endosymbiont of Omalisus fontisbellaquei]|nr:metallophosphoesterase [Rickettsia endosymbiont of Omalisus fontisbellaquei]